MINPTKWQRHPTPVFETPNGALEDFVVLKDENGDYHAYYTRGPNLQDQRLHHAVAGSPLGPFTEVGPVVDGANMAVHTRLYRGKLDANRRIVTAVWPGLPKAGIWLFEDLHVPGGVLEKKSLLVPPLPDTGFSIAAANPCVVYDGKEWNIYFEGRAEEVFWRVYQAMWDEKEVRIIRTALFDGANPSMLKDNGTWYLYASIWNMQKGGFDSWAFTQPVEA